MNMPIRTIVAVWVAKIVSVIIRLLGLGAGATWPGELALRISPNLLHDLSAQSKTIVLVAGTNGKTTTVKMIETILAGTGQAVRRNASGANLDNGIASTLLADTGWDGKLSSDTFLFEVDEASLPIILHSIQPTVVVLLNLFRDQLDRYGEVDAIAKKWLEALSQLDDRPIADSGNQHIKKQTTFIINADDPHLVHIGNQLRASVQYFGLEDPALFLPKMQHATDTIYCPQCGQRLTFGGVYFSHLGTWACGKCGLTHPDVAVAAKDFESPVAGVYNRYNTLAAALACRTLGLSDEQIQQGLKHFIPAFGRMETLVREGKTIKILLSKNPTGFNESLRTAMGNGAQQFLFVLNDRIPDGTDVSWIWDVDFEGLAHDKHLMVVSGDRCFDMALRLKYAGVEASAYHTYPVLEEAIKEALLQTKPGETLWVLATYSAMLEVRKILTGRKIL